MNGENLQSKCKQRFKGVENFLHRIAFNLGNTPSQTDVKIVSCIPIDVTDLQQKIFNLEKQLDEAQKSRGASTIAQASLYKPMVSTSSDPIDSSQFKQSIEHCDHLPENDLKKTNSTACTAMPMINPQQVFPYHSTDTSNLINHNDDSGYKNDNRRNIFRKAKKKRQAKKKDNCNTQFIYYAQTMNSPFNNYDVGIECNKNNYKKIDKAHDVAQSYFVDIMCKQYRPRPLYEEFSDTSQFTSPICRDIEHNFPTTYPYPYESDICSCCHGQFQDVDHFNEGKRIDVMSNNIMKIDNVNKWDYYDSSLYDVIPVKEECTKIKEISRKKQVKDDLNGIYYTAGGHTKNRFPPFVVNYHTSPQAKFNYQKKLSVSVPVRKDKVKRVIPKRNRVAMPVNQQNVIDTSKSCCVDYGDVYSKQIKSSRKHKPTKLLLTYKNAECLTVNVNDTECQTTTTQSVQIDSVSQDDKTEVTLNQIKTILQSVLAEVKINTLKNLSEKSKKDAVVQKGASQEIIEGGSSLLHSFTYSPYNMSPYIATCSRQMNCKQFCYPGQPCPSYKCMHNFPVFIKTPGRQMCANFYRNNSHEHNKPIINKHAVTISTNTENVKDERSKETEKLIKDIYRSIALNIDVPTKDTSTSEYDELLSTTKFNSKIKTDYKPDKTNTISGHNARTDPNVILKRDTQTHLSFTTSNTFNSKLGSNTLSMQSQVHSSTDTDQRLIRNRIEHSLNKKTRRSVDSAIDERMEFDKVNDITIISNQDTESSSNETESENNAYEPVEEPIKKRDRKNIFSKMFKSVKNFKSKGKKEIAIQNDNEYDEESDANDSDDYETIYSHKINRTKPISGQVRRRVPHSKISYSRQMMERNQEKFRRLPYTDQEYKRQWHERMLQEQQRKTSGRMYAEENNRHREHPTYWRNYETRNTMVDQKLPPFENRYTTHQFVDTNRRKSNGPREHTVASKGLAWFNKRKLGIQCGEQWKKLLIEG